MVLTIHALYRCLAHLQAMPRASELVSHASNDIAYVNGRRGHLCNPDFAALTCWSKKWVNPPARQ